MPRPQLRNGFTSGTEQEECDVHAVQGKDHEPMNKQGNSWRTAGGVRRGRGGKVGTNTRSVTSHNAG